jgi:hypothetical protein
MIEEEIYLALYWLKHMPKGYIFLLRQPGMKI